MSPTKSVTGSSSEISVWKSPVPYLFGGLALIVTLISVALIILICCHRKCCSQTESSDEDIEEARQVIPENNYVIEAEPKIVVIMAGDDMPSYLAKSTNSSSICCHCGAEQTSS